MQYYIQRWSQWEHAEQKGRWRTCPYLGYPYLKVISLPFPGARGKQMREVALEWKGNALNENEVLKHSMYL